MHIAHICSFKNGVHSSHINLNFCVLSIRYLIDITLCSPKHPPFGFPTTLQITSVLLNTCFIPNSASSCRKHQLVDECFFKKNFYPHHPPKTSVSRFTTHHPPTFARKHQIEGHNKMHKKQRQTSSKQSLWVPVFLSGKSSYLPRR